MPQPTGQSVVVVPVQACNNVFNVVNHSSAVVHQLHFSHSSLGSWGDDGNYDFRIVWANGRAAEMPQVNVCAASRTIVTNAGLRAQ